MSDIGRQKIKIEICEQFFVLLDDLEIRIYCLLERQPSSVVIFSIMKPF